MAKTAWINRNARKRATVKKYAALRAELKAKKDYAGSCRVTPAPPEWLTAAKLPDADAPLFAGSRCRASLFVN